MDIGYIPFAFGVGGLGFEFCVFVAGWRHALRSEWPFIVLLLLLLYTWAWQVWRHSSTRYLYDTIDQTSAIKIVVLMGLFTGCAVFNVHLCVALSE